MRFLIVGDWHSNLHEEVISSTLCDMGFEISRFPWHHYFSFSGKSFIVKTYIRFQNKYIFGPIVKKINSDLICQAINFRPDIIFIYRGTHIHCKTIKLLRKRNPGVLIIGYNNDDPFANGHSFGLWRHFIKSLKEYDLSLAYRHSNLIDFKAAGAKRVELLRSWYVPELNYPCKLSLDFYNKYKCDVVFIGHYENDIRLSCLEEVVKRGWRLRIFGHQKGWDAALKASPILSGMAPVHTVWGEDYNAALCGAKIALCFLSKLNRDTYTRRCFEIPASGTLLLSERTADLESLFIPGEEADFFSSPHELGNKLDFYLNDERRLQSVAASGHAKVKSAGHDNKSRMNLLLNWLRQLKSE